jgi:hypothetical protein
MNDTYTDGSTEFTRVAFKFNEVTGAGVQGSYGPNDMGYAIASNMQVAMDLRKTLASAYYGYGNKCIERKIDMINSHLAKALMELGKFDREYSQYANWQHAPEPFDPTTI